MAMDVGYSVEVLGAFRGIREGEASRLPPWGGDSPAGRQGSRNQEAST